MSLGRLALQCALGVLGAAALPGLAAAQYGMGGGPAQVPSPEQRQKEFDQSIYWMKHLDRNNNGMLEADEVTGGKSHSHKDIFEGLARKAGLAANVPLATSTMRDRLAWYHQVTPGAASGTPSAPSAPSSAPPPAGTAPAVPGVLPLVPGFGPVPGALPGQVPGAPPPPVVVFGSGPPLARGPAPAAGSSSGGHSSGDAEADRRVREWAAGVMRKYDTNGNGRLEKDEWTKMRDEPRGADRDNDGVISFDELLAHLSAVAKRDWKRDGRGKEGEASAVKSYRSVSPRARLPKGLPDWFLQKDVDQDGQVSMAEFAASWSDSTVVEYFRYDLNRDGVVTPAECLKAMKK
jgi:hypothetical protein